MNNKKSTLWNMRRTKADKTNFEKLANRLGVNESEAVRRAVAHLLEISEKRTHTGNVFPAMRAN